MAKPTATAKTQPPPPGKQGDPQPAADLGPLFPIRLPLIGVCGEFKSGKTSFILSIDPGPKTRLYDFELSSASYTELPFDRVDVFDEMLKAFPKGHKPSQMWEWWRGHVAAIQPGRFSVIGIDTVSPLESALGEWLMEKPLAGRTRRQYVNNLGQPTGLFWGDLKSVWESVLKDAASRCECLAFSAQMGTVYAGNAPTQKRKAKGKETLHQLASLYLRLERKPNAKGELPREPSALIEKERVNRMAVVPGTRKLVITPLLPPRLPVATPEAIRAYMLAPPDYSRLKPEEMAPEERMSDDERAEVRARTAEAEAITAQARVEAARLDREQKDADLTTVGRLIDTVAETRHPAADAPQPTQFKPRPVADDLQAMGVLAEASQVERIEDLLAELCPDEEERDATRTAALEKRGVSAVSELTPEQAQDLIVKLVAILTDDQGEGEKAEQPEGG